MGKIKDILIESHNFNRDMMLNFPYGSNMYTRFYLQVWGLNQMIRIIDRTAHTKNKIINRIKTRGK